MSYETLAGERTKEWTSQLDEAYKHLATEVGTEKAKELVETYGYDAVTEAIYKQRQLLAEEKLITKDDPYPERTLDLSPWNLNVKPSESRPFKSVEENEAYMREILSNTRQPANSDVWKAKKPSTYETRLRAACDLLQENAFSTRILEDLGLGKTQIHDISKNMNAAVSHEADSTVTGGAYKEGRLLSLDRGIV